MPFMAGDSTFAELFEVLFDVSTANENCEATSTAKMTISFFFIQNKSALVCESLKIFFNFFG
jgi:hypothetical protein